MDFTIENKTESLLCVYPGLDQSVLNREEGLGPGASCLNDVKPQKETKWSPECTPDNLELSQMDVVLTVASTGKVIYSATATCQEWLDAGSTITVEQRGDQFAVTDNLPDPEASP